VKRSSLRTSGYPALLSLIGILVFVACSSSTPTATPVPPTATTASAAVTSAPPTATVFQVTIANFALPNITVPVGATVVWTNKDSTSHTVTSGRNGVFDGTGWNSDQVNSGQTFSRPFSQVGTFAYTCRIHPDLNATVTVTQSGTASSGAGSPGNIYNY